MHVNLYLYYILCVLNDSEKKHESLLNSRSFRFLKNTLNIFQNNIYTSIQLHTSQINYFKKIITLNNIKKREIKF